MEKKSCTRYNVPIILLLSVKAIQASAKFKYNYYKGHPHPIDSSIEEG